MITSEIYINNNINDYIYDNSYCQGQGGGSNVEEMAILMSFLEPAQLAELKHRASTTLLKSTNTGVTSGVAQAVEVQTNHTKTSEDTINNCGKYHANANTARCRSVISKHTNTTHFTYNLSMCT